ncbi:hypothetical protein ACA910_008130 [Epithemia clementina (nom. ined.)]
MTRRDPLQGDSATASAFETFDLFSTRVSKGPHNSPCGRSCDCVLLASSSGNKACAYDTPGTLLCNGRRQQESRQEKYEMVATSLDCHER